MVLFMSYVPSGALVAVTRCQWPDQPHSVTHSGDPGNLGNMSLLVITNIATLSTWDKVRRSKKHQSLSCYMLGS